LKAKEGVWGSEFLHNHGDQWAPLPKEWFDQIDRRGKDWTQRLAVALLFLFRINAKRGGVVKLSAGKMLEVCAAGTGGRKQRKTERKRRLSASLDALRDRYGIGVQAGRVHIRHTKNMPSEDWKRRVATFTPPDSIDGELLRNESDGRPPLPKVKGGDWTKDQIKRLRADLGWSQTEMADFLDVSQGYVSQLESGRSKPSGEKCKLLDRLDSRHR
jgi:DNA-binding transcriptional regulator YiaG